MKQRGLPTTAYEIKEGEEYTPYVQQESVAEFTIKSVLAGIVLGIVFGAANAYLGLMAGLTISTSIPLSVLSVVVFRAFSRDAQGTILQANMSQTIGSASSSVASGVLFTIPALFMWARTYEDPELAPSLLQLTLLAMCGALIGILIMIPLRRFLIKKEHGKLPYPEGLACAEVLVASEEGGSHAVNVFWGLGVGFLFKLLTDGLKLIGKSFEYTIGKFTIAAKVSPALIGVGYILGPRIATVMVAGAALSSFVIIPIIFYWGQGLDTPFYPEEKLLIRDMPTSELWNRYVRYIGAGAVACAGIITLIRSIPTMIESVKIGVSHMGAANGDMAKSRTDSDLSFKTVLVVVGIILLILTFVPGILGYLDSIPIRAVAAVLCVVFAFFFVTVASRIVGLVGVTSNPVSGMTIATLLGTSLIFLAFGWTDLYGKATALMVGTVVCIAASISGDTSQDLKTGFLLGATPRRQQIGEIIGAIASAFFVCWTVQTLDTTMVIGSKDLPAPQATLMRLVIDGVIEQKLPWILIGIGVGLSLIAFLLRLPALAFAVGVYLPLSTMAPIFFGGLLRQFLTRTPDEKTNNARREGGVLFASGLVGGEGLMGVGLALYVLWRQGEKIPGVAGIPPLALDLGAILGIVTILIIIGIAAMRKRPELDESSR